MADKDIEEQMDIIEDAKKQEELWCEHCQCFHVDRGPWISGPK